MVAAVSRLGMVVVPARGQRSAGGGDAALRRVLVERFGAQVVALSEGQLASPEHARRAVGAAVAALRDVDVVVLAVTGTVWHFARGSGDLVMLALPGSTPARPRSMLPLADLGRVVRARRPEASVIVCADLVGSVSSALVAERLPDVALLLAAGEDAGAVCHDALATTLTEIDSPCAVDDLVEAAGRLAGGNREVLVRRGGRAVGLAPLPGMTVLPAGLRQDLTSPVAGSRLDAAAELAALADPLARTHLRRLAAEDPDRGVREFASRLLRRADQPVLPRLARDGLIPADILHTAGTDPDVPQLRGQPGGRVPIGVDAPAGDASCRPRHHVDVAPYRLGRTVVTNRQYLAFVVATGHGCPDHWATGEGLWADPDLPVVMVSWCDATRYCAWLTRHLHGSGALARDWRIRLPSEVEWEAAAGNGRGDPYPWGTAPQPWPANTRAAGIGAVTAVGRYPGGVNATGCHDLIGNVWEWTRSRWGTTGRTPAFGYPYQAADGREADETPENMRFIIRGGSYYYATECANSYTRNRMHATDRHPAGGFRVAAIRTEGAT
ncbi:formylglycine-generating enzyme family protein [Micromonospora sp. CA-263727]|uniref:formylglycine-generating enzyme family protein n=1 Tax=Micromonospora sp. CA-263727 TaxID=3239967 RepID=UPI003D9354D8